jgi:multiple sugar transport system permease protein
MKRGALAWAFAAPAVLVIGGFFLLPVLMAAGVSLTDFDLYAFADIQNVRFVGLGNYAHLLQSSEFWRALANSLLFVGMGTPLTLGAGLIAALLISSRLTIWPSFFRTVLFAPVVTTLVAVALVWRYLLHTRYGLFNWLLISMGLHPIDWLGDARWAIPAIALFAAWKNFGFSMLIFIAARQNIPGHLYEAAWLDGASPLQQFRSITLPALRPAVLLTGVVTVAGYFQMFAEPYVITQGGPLQSTVSVVYLMYEQGFRWWNFGSASAVAFVLFWMVLAIVTLRRRFGNYFRWTI